MINIVEKYKLKVGDKISLFPPDANYNEELVGIIGEINYVRGNFYVWNNDMSGSNGNIYPSDEYTCSWSVNIDQEENYDLRLKILNKKAKINTRKLNKTLCDLK